MDPARVSALIAGGERADPRRVRVRRCRRDARCARATVGGCRPLQRRARVVRSRGRRGARPDPPRDRGVGPGGARGTGASRASRACPLATAVSWTLPDAARGRCAPVDRVRRAAARSPSSSSRASTPTTACGGSCSPPSLAPPGPASTTDPASGLSPARSPHTTVDAGRHARELGALLATANVHGPLVVVGHSYGGLVARAFVARYPTRVAGLVLVEGVAPYDRLSHYWSEGGDRVDTWASSAAARLMRLGSVPLVVLSAQDPDRSYWGGPAYGGSARGHRGLEGAPAGGRRTVDALDVRHRAPQRPRRRARPARRRDRGRAPSRALDRDADAPPALRPRVLRRPALVPVSDPSLTRRWRRGRT